MQHLSGGSYQSSPLVPQGGGPLAEGFSDAEQMLDLIGGQLQLGDTLLPMAVWDRAGREEAVGRPHHCHLVHGLHVIISGLSFGSIACTLYSKHDEV